jgi:hypothetical protein
MGAKGIWRGKEGQGDLRWHTGRTQGRVSECQREALMAKGPVRMQMMSKHRGKMISKMISKHKDPHVTERVDKPSHPQSEECRRVGNPRSDTRVGNPRSDTRVTLNPPLSLNAQRLWALLPRSLNSLPLLTRT